MPSRVTIKAVVCPHHSWKNSWTEPLCVSVCIFLTFFFHHQTTTLFSQPFFPGRCHWGEKSRCKHPLHLVPHPIFLYVLFLWYPLSFSSTFASWCTCPSPFVNDFHWAASPVFPHPSLSLSPLLSLSHGGCFFMSKLAQNPKFISLPSWCQSTPWGRGTPVEICIPTERLGAFACIVKRLESGPSEFRNWREWHDQGECLYNSADHKPCKVAMSKRAFSTSSGKSRFDSFPSGGRGGGMGLKVSRYAPRVPPYNSETVFFFCEGLKPLGSQYWSGFWGKGPTIKMSLPTQSYSQ